MRDFDVIVVGGGPAGSMAALALARAGIQVGLLEKSRLPSDKVCGDALLPDSMAVLEAVGLIDAVAQQSHSIDGVDVAAPGGSSFGLEVPLCAIRRQVLDALLIEAAVKAGAVLHEGVRADSPLLTEGGVVRGVRCATDGGVRFEARATVTILATGASSKVLRKFGVCLRTQPSALAMRAYWRAPGLDEGRALVGFERGSGLGAGWIIPLGDGVANVGCGVFLEGNTTPMDLRALQARFLARDLARSALAGGEALTEARGAPLRCDLGGARAISSGLLVAGEALGTSYGLTGAGVGKAMASGRLAAMAAIGALNTGESDALEAYVKLMARDRFGEKFHHREVARRWMAGRRGLVSLLGWRLGRSPRLRAQVEAILREEDTGERLMSFSGVLRAVILGR